MGILANIDANTADLATKFAAMATVYNEENWLDFYSIYGQDEQTRIKENLAALKQKLTEISALNLPADAALLSQKLTELDGLFETLPTYQRLHFQGALKSEAKKQNLKDLVDIATPITNEIYDPNQPLVFHLAGTEVPNNTLGDPLASLAREQTNFYIQKGVDRYTGSQGRENVDKIVADIRAKYTANPTANKRIILTGYSRGAAAQIYLANRIHEAFNKGKEEKDWVKIDMFLVDPTFGIADSAEDAVTREYIIPRCVNTLNILHSDSGTPEKDWFLHPWLITKRTRDTLKSDPNYTTIQSITLKGDHKGVGLLDLNLLKRAASYVTDALCRAFFAHAGRETKADNLPTLDNEYIKKNVVATKQSSVAMQYYSSYATRLTQDVSRVDATAMQFSAQIPQLLVSENFTKEQQQYHDLNMKIFGAIIHGDYETRFFGLSGEKHVDRQSRLPNHMYQMCEAIETYCNSLKTDTPLDPKATFHSLQTIAKTATDNGSLVRTSSINAFYSNIKHATDVKALDKTEEAVGRAAYYLAPK